jgi:hypothetical protein
MGCTQRSHQYTTPSSCLGSGGGAFFSPVERLEMSISLSCFVVVLVTLLTADA